MGPNILFIVNPNSRSGKTSKVWESKILPQVLSFFPNANWSFTSCQYEASLLAYSAKKRGYDIVVAVGGDGTINEIVNGLMSNILIPHKGPFNSKIFGTPLSLSENKNEVKKTTLACLPLGTGSDFVKSLGIPNNIKKALEIIKEGKQIFSDVGLIEFENKELKTESRYFINIAGCGANGETVQIMNESKKHFGGRGAFFVAAIRTLLKNQSFPIQISFDDEQFIPFDLRVLFVCNGQYCGGGMPISNDASLQSGKLKVVQVRQMNKIKSIFLLDRLYSGNYEGLEKDIFVREATFIKIKPANQSPVPLECDGEMPGYLHQLNFLYYQNPCLY